MTLAHIGGVPFEEWLAPLVATGYGVGAALRAAVRRLRQRHCALDPHRCGVRAPRAVAATNPVAPVSRRTCIGE